MKVISRELVAKDFRKIPEDDKQKIITELRKLEAAKTLSESSNLKKMENTDNRYRMRVGNYRVLLEWDKQQQTIFVITVAHRSHIYKKR